jgi:hypothetical protein
MDKILAGIYGLYSASVVLKAALTGGLFFEHTSAGASMPYATYMLVSGRTEYLLNAELFELPRIQFDIYAETNAVRLSCYNALIAVYDDAKPAATGYNPIIMERSFYQMLRAGDQDQLFRAIVEYECRWGKS